MSGDYYRACAGCDSPCGCPLTAPRRESVGQQQAAAEVRWAKAYEEWNAGPREMGTGRRMAFLAGWQAARHLLVGEAARPGQELRARLNECQQQWSHAVRREAALRAKVARVEALLLCGDETDSVVGCAALRAALEDPR